MPSREPFALKEWYHCYNRGVDKRRVFLTDSDYKRFTLLLYTCNDSKPTRFYNLSKKSLDQVVTDSSYTRNPLVSIGAYCLMPNHVHLALYELAEGGISLFMQKVMTGYTMYFNKSKDRTGALFAGTFKSKHVANDRYLKHLIAYIHLNPAELFDPKWKYGTALPSQIHKELLNFQHSSLIDYDGQDRPENALIGGELREMFDQIPSAASLVQEAHAYYSSIQHSFKV
jgi:REP element-mobilizing transposase RayT